MLDVIQDMKFITESFLSFWDQSQWGLHTRDRNSLLKVVPLSKRLQKFKLKLSLLFWMKCRIYNLLSYSSNNYFLDLKDPWMTKCQNTDTQVLTYKPSSTEMCKLNIQNCSSFLYDFFVCSIDHTSIWWTPLSVLCCMVCRWSKKSEC